MCPPDFFGIRYEINPWMNRAIGADHTRANQQWDALRRVLTEEIGAEILLIDPVENLPDMVFTANAGYVRKNLFVPSRFRFEQRRGEEARFRHWFEENGYRIVDLPDGGNFEGFGDALPVGCTILAGFRYRSDIGSHQQLGELLGQRVISLELTDPRFYHLDTCLCPLTCGDLLYYPGAFDEYGLRAIEGLYPPERRVAVSEEDALTFCCNAVSVAHSVVLNTGADTVVRELRTRGLTVYETPFSEFIKAGGAAKCLTLRLD